MGIHLVSSVKILLLMSFLETEDIARFYKHVSARRFVRRSVRWSVCPSVYSSVRPSVRRVVRYAGGLCGRSFDAVQRALPVSDLYTPALGTGTKLTGAANRTGRWTIIVGWARRSDLQSCVTRRKQCIILQYTGVRIVYLVSSRPLSRPPRRHVDIT